VTQFSDTPGTSHWREPQGDPARHAAPGGARPWWRSPWATVALAAVVIFNLFYALPRYLSFDPARSRVPLSPTFPEHWTILVLHAVTGNIALVTLLIQLTPWVRRNHPKVHRVSGRLYIFAGVLPGAGLAFVLLPYSTAPTGKLGLATMATLWIFTTLMGYRYTLQHRYVEHRRWMLYSFALALGTSWGRVYSQLMQHFPALQFNIMIFLEMSSWLGWIVNLVIAQWWIEHTAARVSQQSLAPGREAEQSLAASGR
jgi:hypothetical protein